jgi:YHS domain-containing protein
MNYRDCMPVLVVSIWLISAGLAPPARGAEPTYQPEAPAREAAGTALASADDASPEVPEALAPFDYLLGRWRGTGVPKDNPAKSFRGWNETHTWAWAFAAGKLVGLSVTIEGGKIFTTGKLTYDRARKVYRLQATEPKPGGSVIFEGSLDRSRKQLVLERLVDPSKPQRESGKVKLTIWPNANFIRYTMTEDLQEPGAFQFHRLIEVGLTREGESLAGVSAALERPKCIVTGGAATMTVSFQGQTFPICCTGCRDEFNENPEKYLKKAALLQSAAASKSSQPSGSRVTRFDDAFANDVADAPAPSAKAMKKTEAADARTESSQDVAKKTDSATGKKTSRLTTPSKQPNRAAQLLKLGQNLEKVDKASLALEYYHQVVKDFPGSPAAKTAQSRIKALEKR